ncbi:MAG: class I SAM-dependent methyltransferase [bacterium]|nr:class I SAM-dependent methyltransferase [bacterium]
MNHYDYCAQFVKSGEDVLDVGAGKGFFCCEMAKRGFNAYGIEINPAYIVKAKERANDEKVNVSILHGNAEKLPYEDSKFSFVNASEVTEHVEDPIAMCNEIYRVLKSGAKSYISFHNRYGIYDYHYHLYFINWMPRSWTEFVLKLLKKQKPDGEAGRQKLITMYYYTYGEVKRLLEKLGFEVEDIRVGKIKKKFKFFSIILLPLYYIILRPLYFNTFHILVTKSLDLKK